MANIRRVIRCQGCGAILQSEDKNKPGYISKSVIENGTPKIPYCNDCYEKKLNLNSSELENTVDKDTLKILKDATATDALVIWVVDLFSFNGTLNSEVVKKIKKLKVIVFGTKRDLFDSSVSNETLERFIDERFAECGINPVWIQILGKENALDATALMKKINSLREGHDVYMIGNLNSGKTTIINKFLENYKNNTKWPIKTEKYPNTNADVLEIPLSNSSFLYELPDLSNKTSVLSNVEKEAQRVITPKKEVKMTRFILGDEKVICVGCLAAFYILKGRHTSYRIFAAENVELKTLNLDKADTTIAKMLKNHSLQPYSKNFTSFEDFDLFEYDLEDDGLRHDIGIEGLCTLSVRGQGQTIRVALPKGAALKESLSKVR
ncbi:MAG: hypothetical protein MJ225_00270 [Bacilli bacterium]|nr:hypothetical protein [Bacilli bacterium]